LPPRTFSPPVDPCRGMVEGVFFFYFFFSLLRVLSPCAIASGCANRRGRVHFLFPPFFQEGEEHSFFFPSFSFFFFLFRARSFPCLRYNMGPGRLRRLSFPFFLPRRSRFFFFFFPLGRVAMRALRKTVSTLFPPLDKTGGPFPFFFFLLPCCFFFDFKVLPRQKHAFLSSRPGIFFFFFFFFPALGPK